MASQKSARQTAAPASRPSSDHSEMPGGATAAKAGIAPVADAGRFSRTEWLADILRERILNGTYAPGERIREIQLRNEFGFSNGPIREAYGELFRRGKYPDVILPMCVLRRMDAVLEPTKEAVLDTKQMLDDARITEQRCSHGSEQRRTRASANTARQNLA